MWFMWFIINMKLVILMNEQEILKIKKELESLPKGTITHKKISGKIQFGTKE